MEERVEHFINDTISTAELETATTKYNLAYKEDKLTTNIRFEYALALTRSRLACDNHRAVKLLEDLSSTGDPDAFRDYLFYLIVANIKLNDYVRAKDCAKKFLSVEPNNRQAKDLSDYIEKKLFSKEMKGLAVVGSAAVVIGAAAALLLRR